MQKMLRGMRAAARSVLGIGMVSAMLPLVILQGAVIGPLLNNHTVLPGLFYNGIRRLFGIRVEFNAASAPIEDKKPVWYVANHMSIADFLILGSVLRGTFAGKGDIMRWPGIAPLARAVKYIGIRRVNKDDPDFEKFHRQTIGKIMQNFNDGHNTIMFPEGTTTDGSQVALFRAGLISMLFGAEGLDKHGNPVRLEKDVCVQPIAIRVKNVEGKDISARSDLREFYAHYNTNNTLKRIWTRMATRDITIEVTAFSPLSPKDYKDQFALINEAGALIRGVVAPDQKTVEPARIPGGKDRNRQTGTQDPRL